MTYVIFNYKVPSFNVALVLLRRSV